ncbi:hypothetical protein C8Q80DRAFT_1173340 [Daedaleopsis nitida]|nr:hypothetical protein C8Q80DRAFT_1173340 [Daedaleopsis nitida]
MNRSRQASPPQGFSSANASTYRSLYTEISGNFTARMSLGSASIRARHLMRVPSRQGLTILCTMLTSDLPELTYAERTSRCPRQFA